MSGIDLIRLLQKQEFPLSSHHDVYCSMTHHKSFHLDSHSCLVIKTLARKGCKFQFPLASRSQIIDDEESGWQGEALRFNWLPMTCNSQRDFLLHKATHYETYFENHLEQSFDRLECTVNNLD